MAKDQSKSEAEVVSEDEHEMVSEDEQEKQQEHERDSSSSEDEAEEDADEADEGPSKQQQQQQAKEKAADIVKKAAAAAAAATVAAAGASRKRLPSQDDSGENWVTLGSGTPAASSSPSSGKQAAAKRAKEDKPAVLPLAPPSSPAPSSVADKPSDGEPVKPKASSKPRVAPTHVSRLRSEVLEVFGKGANMLNTYELREMLGAEREHLASIEKIVSAGMATEELVAEICTLNKRIVAMSGLVVRMSAAERKDELDFISAAQAARKDEAAEADKAGKKGRK